MPKPKAPRAVLPVKAKAETPPRLPSSLTVKDSTIAGAGKGLFAKRRLKKGTRLGEYIGERLTYAQAHGRDESYFIHTSEDGKSGFVIDGKRMDNPMRWPNHSWNNNAQAEIQEDGRIIFRTKKPVGAGKEIFINYGYQP